MAVGPIPRSAVKAYADEFGITGDEFDKFLSIIRTVDNDYLRLINSSNSKSINDGAVPIDDTDGVKDVMLRLQARAKSNGKSRRKPN